MVNVRKKNKTKSEHFPKQQNINVVVNKFQITCPPKLAETVSIIQYHQFSFAIYIWITKI